MIGNFEDFFEDKRKLKDQQNLITHCRRAKILANELTTEIRQIYGKEDMFSKMLQVESVLKKRLKEEKRNLEMMKNDLRRRFEMMVNLYGNGSTEDEVDGMRGIELKKSETLKGVLK